MPPSDLKRLALLMAVNCVRNTVVEDYHAEGKLSDVEMKAMNKEVANKIYTFLHYLFSDSVEDQEVFLAAMGMMYPNHWDQPKLDADFVQSVKLLKKVRSQSENTPNRRTPPTTPAPPQRTRRKKT
jgi:hypothetical protein